MKVMVYEIAFQNYNAFSQAKCMECFPGLFVPFEIQMQDGFPAPTLFYLLQCVKEVQVQEVH